MCKGGRGENGKRYECENRVGDVRELGGGAEDCSGRGDEAVGGLREYCFRAGGIDLSMEGESRECQGILVGDQNYSAPADGVGEGDRADAQL